MSPRPPGSRRLPWPIAAALYLPAVLALTSSCAPPPYALALDPAFIALRPALAAELSRGLPAPLRLDGGATGSPEGAWPDPAAVIDAYLALPDRSRPGSLVASPLLARAILEAEGRSGLPLPEAGLALLGGARLIVVEAPPGEASRATALRSDPLPAFARAGRALGAQVAALRGEGASASNAALVLADDGELGPGVEGAFVEAFTLAAGFAPLVLRLPPGPAGAPPSDADAAEALRGLRDRDPRFFLVAAGPAGPAAFRAASEPTPAAGRAPGPTPPLVGLAGADPGVAESAAFRLMPDERALARAARRLAGRGADPEPEETAAPAWTILAGRAAREAMAGSESLADRLR